MKKIKRIFNRLLDRVRGNKGARRSVMYTSIALFAALVIVVCVLLYRPTVGYGAFIDTTSEELYTLSEEMKREMDPIKADVEITFCAEPDILLGNYETRYVYVMAKDLEKRYDNISVKYINAKKHPELADRYRSTSATSVDEDDIIISSGARYRLLSASGFWTKDDSGKYWAFNGEYKTACAILSVTATDRPLVCFTTSHGEKYFNPDNLDASDPDYEEFYNLLSLAGLRVSYIDLDRQDIPEECVMLIINGATVDYRAEADGIYRVDYTSPIEKIDRFLSKNNSLFITKEPYVSLPTLEEYAREWGLGFGDDRVQTSQTEDGRRLFAVYADKEKDAIGYSLYSDIASLASAPKTVMKNSSQINLLWADGTKSSAEKYISPGLSVMASSVLKSSDKAVPYNSLGEQHMVNKYGKEAVSASDLGEYTLAAISVRTRYVGVNYYYAYLFASGSSEMLTNEYLGNSSYANNDIIFSAVRTMTRTDRYASDDLGALNLNTEKYGGKKLLSSELSEEKNEVYEKGKLVRTYSAVTTSTKVIWSILIAIPPLVIIPTLGIIVYIKRKNR